MANTATLYRFGIDLSDIDRGVYQTLDLRVARHPSEDEERLVVRVLAHALLYEEGLEFGRGLSTVEDAALWTRTPAGQVQTWVDVGLPSADRLHRASKQAERVVIVTHKPPEILRKEWLGEKIHRPERVELVQLSPALVRELADRLERGVHWYVTVQEQGLTIVDGDQVVEGAVGHGTLAAFLQHAADASRSP